MLTDCVLIRNNHDIDHVDNCELLLIDVILGRIKFDKK